MTEEIVNSYGRKIKQLRLIPSSGGVFEVSLNGSLIFSKKSLDRWPREGEIVDLIEEHR